jgi:bifunctional UDP-N-acetylglucosamine pyrophosphorylase/glucosamine-1-phosphate N-acetyltransferase
MSFTAIILAAGKGSRMQSTRPKVMHSLAGRPMLAFVLDAAHAAGAAQMIPVIGPDVPELAEWLGDLTPAIQPEQRGTGDAVRAALPLIADRNLPVLILYGDTPLVRADRLAQLAAAIAAGADICVLGFESDRPDGYGRLKTDKDGQLLDIVEQADASQEEQQIRLCNGGLMAVAGLHLAGLLDGLSQNNAQAEFYLTDLVRLAREKGLQPRISMAEREELHGVNNRADLAFAEAVIQDRLRRAALAGGVSMVDPASVYLSADTRLAADITLEPNVIIGPGCSIAAGCHIKAFSHIEGAEIGPNCQIGPFARLRPGTRLAEAARIGNFVETKQAEIGSGAKINHLSYVGDAEIGAAANIGAGTITCNYDGHGKYRTLIGEQAFIGSNTALVAPVSVGARAIIGAGSVIAEDVPEAALSLARPPQENRPGAAERFRQKAQEKNQKAKK